ncbi:MAG: PHP domain-containing protein [Clostridia bacterium]|nr:PHP domain-containing protein [Clostridia bacterium]
MTRCDLHTHSVYSDGTYTPAQLIEDAEAMSLAAIALTDHNTTKGLAKFLAAAEGKTVTTVPRVELSTCYNGKPLHIIAMFLPNDQYAAVESYMADALRRDAENMKKQVALLQKAGYAIDYPTLRQKAKVMATPAHIKRELWEQGYAPSMKEVDRILRNVGKPDFPVEYPDAIETIYSAYDEKTAAKAAEIAKEFGLLPSGGSDFHGENRPEIQLVTGRGGMSIPKSVYDGLLGAHHE